MSVTMKKIILSIVPNLPKGIKRFLVDYRAFRMSYYEDANLFAYFWNRYFNNFRKGDYWVKNKNSVIYGNILMGKNSKLALRGGCYIQGQGRLFVGDYVEITQNCIVITANHNLYNQEEHTYKETIIGDHCWIASNACIMAGVVLGPRTIVAAGSVVTKSFPEGFCVIAGNPAKKVKDLDRNLFVPRKYPIEHYGYIRADKFPKYKSKYLSHLKFNYDLSKVTDNQELIKDTIANHENNEIK